MTDQVRDNITAISNAILPQDSKGVPQIVSYLGGVGTGLGLWARLSGAATGEEIKANVRDAYLFLVNNYIEGSEIYLFGWSRGAYTARVVSGLIYEVGLLKVSGAEYFGKLFDAFFDPKVETRSVVPESLLIKVEVECLGLWETVGSLGIPDSGVLGFQIPILDQLLERWNHLQWYRFNNTVIPATSRIGLQAYASNKSMLTKDSFAIDEDLRFLSPTLWIMPEDSKNILRQVWFAGLHPSICGAYAPHAFGDISLCWMVSEVSTLTSLEFDKDFLFNRLKGDTPQIPSWGAVPSPPFPLFADKFAYTVGPKLQRTPGKYPTPVGYVSNEYYHHSVLERIAGTKDGYPSGVAVAKVLPKLPYTKMEFEFAVGSGLTTPEQVQEFWEV